MMDMVDALMGCVFFNMRLYVFMDVKWWMLMGHSFKHRVLHVLHILGLYFDKFQKLAPNQAEKRKEVEAKLAEEEKARQAKGNTWSPRNF